MATAPETRRAARRPQARGRATRERLLHAALELFTRNGYSGTSIGDVAESAGVGVGTVYHHFADKRALLLELIEKWGDRMEAEGDAESIRRPLTANDPRRALQEWLRAAYQRLREQPSLYLVTLAVSRRDPDIGRAYRRIEGLAIDRLARLITEGQQQGRFRSQLDPQAAAFLVHHLIEGAALQLLVHEVPEPEPERVVVELSEMISGHLLGPAS